MDEVTTKVSGSPLWDVARQRAARHQQDQARRALAAEQAAKLVGLVGAVTVSLSRTLNRKSPQEACVRAIDRLGDALNSLQSIGASSNSPAAVIMAAADVGRAIGAMEEVAKRKQAISKGTGEKRVAVLSRKYSIDEAIAELAGGAESAPKLAERAANTLNQSPATLTRKIQKARRNLRAMSMSTAPVLGLD